MVDNDYLYVASRTGLVGLVLHLAILSTAAVGFARTRVEYVGLIGAEYLLFAMILGFLADTLGGWGYPILLFFYLGLAMGNAGPIRGLEDGGVARWAAI